MGTSNAQIEAVRRYEEKTYKRYTFQFRLDEDREIIDSIENAKEEGINKREWLSAIYHYGGNPKEVVPEGLVSLDAVRDVLLAFRVSGAEDIIDELKKRGEK